MPEKTISEPNAASHYPCLSISPSPADVIAKKKKKSKPMSFERYILKIVKELHPNMGLTNKTVRVIDYFIMYIMGRIAKEAKNFANKRHSVTLTHKDLESACKLILPGKMATLAVSSGIKAIRKYNGYIPTANVAI